ncbi:MAG: hypothetical protein ACJ731_10945 [Vicinamibacterales bacterium]
MTVAEFKRTTSENKLAATFSAPLRALWHDARGEWDAAHEVAQKIDDATGAWIHAYLHRKEGDLGNAGYWYRRAEKPECRGSLDAEWEEIAAALLPQP